MDSRPDYPVLIVSPVPLHTVTPYRECLALNEIANQPPGYVEDLETDDGKFREIELNRRLGVVNTDQLLPLVQNPNV